MGISMILVIGILGVFLALFSKNQILARMGDHSKIIQSLSKSAWYQNYWLSGFFLFGINAVLFSLTGLILYGLTCFLIPFIHILVMFLAVMVSIILWVYMNKAWQGTKRNRLKMGAVGSSFYLSMTVIFAYFYVTLKPSFPGDDLLMAAVGLMFAMIVTTVACISCFVITGFSKKEVV